MGAITDHKHCKEGDIVASKGYRVKVIGLIKGYRRDRVVIIMQ
jgi:hypothetical protein